MKKKILIGAALGACIWAGVPQTACLLEADGVDGQAWCIRAHAATGHRSDNEMPVPITHPNTGDFMHGCYCHCPWVANIIQDGIADLLTPSSPEEALYLAELDATRSLAESRCDSRLAILVQQHGVAIEFDDKGDETCEDAVADEELYSKEASDWCIYGVGDCEDAELDFNDTGEPTPGDPPPQGTAGEPGADETADVDGGGAPVYPGEPATFDDVVECSGSHCDVDIDFIQAVFDDSSVFEDDYIGVGLGVSVYSQAGFEFESLGSQSLPYALGFRQGDIVYELNGHDITTASELGDAAAAVSEDSEFTVKLHRGSVMLTLTFEIVDLGSYP